MNNRPDTIEKQQSSQEICKGCCNSGEEFILCPKHKKDWDTEIEFLAEFFVNLYLTKQKN